MKRVSIIIVNYNNSDVLPACLKSIDKWCDPESTEVIVVDNNSKEDGLSQIKTDFPDIKYVEAGENLGFGKANNLGSTFAAGKYLFLLNPDTELLTPVPTLLADYMDEYGENTACIGAEIVNIHGKPDVSSGNFPTPLGLIKELFPSRYFPYRLKTKPADGGAYSVDYVSGADIMISSVLFKAHKGFDPDFFLYYEETEFQWRLAKAGYDRRILPSAKLMHICGTTDHKLSSKKIEIFEKSRILFFSKVYGLFGQIFARISLLIFYSSRLLFGGPKHYWSGIRTALR